MDKIFKKIENYLISNFGKDNNFILDTEIVDDENADLWGFHTVKILVKRDEQTGDIHYKPIFNNSK